MLKGRKRKSHGPWITFVDDLAVDTQCHSDGGEANEHRWHRERRFNAVTNYDFDQGVLKGVNIGGGIRYQSDIVIGYPSIPGATAAEINFDLANPYRGPAETNFDFFIGYHRRIARNIDWRIQLNIRNLFEGNRLIPINAQPDGSAAGFRIAPYQTWMITNTFTF